MIGLTREGSKVGRTYAYPDEIQVGRAAPSLTGGNVVHALRVARVTALLAARYEGLGVESDSYEGNQSGLHVADARLTFPVGIDGHSDDPEVWLTEVERTPKGRDLRSGQKLLEQKLQALPARWDAEGLSGTWYLVEPRAEKSVRETAARVLSAANRKRLRIDRLGDYVRSPSSEVGRQARGNAVSLDMSHVSSEPGLCR